LVPPPVGCIRKLNNGEGGTQGTNVTPANSGGASGDAYDVVTTSATCSLTYDNTHVAHGAFAEMVTLGSTAGVAHARWDNLGGVSTVWFRTYLYFTANPGGTINVQVAMGAGVVRGSIAINTAGKVILKEAIGSTAATSTNSIPLNAWWRLEGYILGSSGTGAIEAKIFDVMDSTTPLETLSASAINTGGAIDSVRLGHNGTTVANVTFWMDDLGIDTCAYLGPVLKPVVPQSIVGRFLTRLPIASRRGQILWRTPSSQVAPPVTPPLAGLARRRPTLQVPRRGAWLSLPNAVAVPLPAVHPSRVGLRPARRGAFFAVPPVQLGAGTGPVVPKTGRLALHFPGPVRRGRVFPPLSFPPPTVQAKVPDAIRGQHAATGRPYLRKHGLIPPPLAPGATPLVVVPAPFVTPRVRPWASLRTAHRVAGPLVWPAADRPPAAIVAGRRLVPGGRRGRFLSVIPAQIGPGPGPTIPRLARTAVVWPRTLPRRGRLFPPLSFPPPGTQAKIPDAIRRDARQRPVLPRRRPVSLPPPIPKPPPDFRPPMLRAQGRLAQRWLVPNRRGRPLPLYLVGASGFRARLSSYDAYHGPTTDSSADSAAMTGSQTAATITDRSTGGGSITDTQGGAHATSTDGI